MRTFLCVYASVIVTAMDFKYKYQLCKLKFMLISASGPSGPVTEKSNGPDEKSLVRIFKIKYFLF